MPSAVRARKTEAHREVARVAAGLEARSEIALERQQARKTPYNLRERHALEVHTEVPHPGGDACFGRLGLARNHVDNAADGVGAVERRTGAAQHLHAIHRFERQHQVHVESARSVDR